MANLDGAAAELTARALAARNSGTAGTLAFMAGNMAEKEGLADCPFDDEALVGRWNNGFNLSLKVRRKRRDNELVGQAAAVFEAGDDIDDNPFDMNSQATLWLQWRCHFRLAAHRHATRHGGMHRRKDIW